MILTICHWWIIGLWVVFIVYWIIAAIPARRGLNRNALRGTLRIRLLLLAVIAVPMALSRRSSAVHDFQFAIFWNVYMAIAGAAIGTLGAALAFSARASIGRNWGPPQTRRTDTELVTSGPYAFVRHSIYSGILLLMIGTAIGLIATWWIVTAAAGTYFFISALAEEKHLVERFPQSYPAYRARTRMLIPFLL